MPTNLTGSTINSTYDQLLHIDGGPVGGTGTWNTTNTTNWSATSGGAGGASVPTASDVAYIDANSGVGL